MKVTKPMIARGVEALNGSIQGGPEDLVETILRAALNDPKEPDRPMPGQTTVYDFLHDERV
jgi:hypothetical protein